MTKYATIFTASSVKAHGSFRKILFKEEWYPQTPTCFSFSELIKLSQSIPTILKRETGAKTTFLTLPIRLLQKKIVDNAKTIDAISSTIKLEEKKERIISVEAIILFIELFNNKRKLS